MTSHTISQREQNELVIGVLRLSRYLLRRWCRYFIGTFVVRVVACAVADIIIIAVVFAVVVGGVAVLGSQFRV